MIAERSPRRIGGWLLLLIEWLGVIDPIWTVALNGWYVSKVSGIPFGPALFGPGSWDYWSYFALREGLRISAAFALLFVRRPAAVWYTLLVLWIAGPVMTATAAGWSALGTEFILGALTRSGPVAILWSGYLLASKRVKATYDFEGPFG